MIFPVLVKMDIASLYRQKILHAYGLVVLLYLAGLFFVPPVYRETAIVMIVFNDATGIGFFFVGALMLFESRQGTLAALMVTPVTAKLFILSRVFSFALVTLFFSLLLFLLPVGGRADLTHALPGLFLASSVFTALGIVIALFSDSVNGYLARGMAVMLPFAAAYAGALGVAPSRIWYMGPFKGAVMLYRTAYFNVDHADILFSYLSLFIWAVGMIIIAVKIMESRRSIITGRSR